MLKLGEILGEIFSKSEIFQGGRNISVLIPKGLGGKGWSSFQKALKALLYSEYMLESGGKFGAASKISGGFVNTKRSFAEVVRNKEGVPSHGDSIGSFDGDSGTGNRKVIAPKNASNFTAKNMSSQLLKGICMSGGRA